MGQGGDGSQLGEPTAAELRALAAGGRDENTGDLDWVKIMHTDPASSNFRTSARGRSPRTFSLNAVEALDVLRPSPGERPECIRAREPD
jgi:hypothetical protein